MTDMNDQMSDSELADIFNDRKDAGLYANKSAYSKADKGISIMENFFRYHKVKLTERAERDWVSQSDLAWYLCKMYGGFEVHPVKDGEGVFISVQRDKEKGDIWLCEKIFYPHKCPNSEEIACIIPPGMGELIGKKVEETERGWHISTKGYWQHGLSMDEYYMLGNMAKDNQFKKGNDDNTRYYRWTPDYYCVEKQEVKATGRSCVSAEHEYKTLGRMLVDVACPTQFMKEIDHINGNFLVYGPDTKIKSHTDIDMRSLVNMVCTMNLEVQHKVRKFTEIGEWDFYDTVMGNLEEGTEDKCDFEYEEKMQRQIYRYPGSNNHYGLCFNFFNPKYYHRADMLMGHLMTGLIFGGFRAMMESTGGIEW